MESGIMEHDDGIGRCNGTEHTKASIHIEIPAHNVLLRHLVEHTTFDMTLLFTKQQYVLWSLNGNMLRPTPISPNTLQAAFAEEPIDTGWLPENIKRWGYGQGGCFMVKYIPPGRHTLFLATTTGAHRVLSVPLPALVFAGVNDASPATYYVWAMKEATWNPSANLFHAPFANVYADGHICWGTVHPPEVSWETIDEAWQFFINDSLFNGSLIGGKSRSYPDDVCRQLLDCEKRDHYPLDDLNPIQMNHWWQGGSAEQLTMDRAVKVYLLKTEAEERSEHA
jgi:PRTRC genetic system protein B